MTASDRSKAASSDFEELAKLAEEVGAKRVAALARRAAVKKQAKATRVEKVRIAFVVEIDWDAWKREYDPVNIREDVREYIPQIVTDFLGERGLGHVC